MVKFRQNSGLLRVQFIQDSGLLKVQFIQYSDLLKVRFRQISLYYVDDCYFRTVGIFSHYSKQDSVINM
jgi:hypothetical protein